MIKNCIPYIEIKTSKGILKFLIDTGSNKSYIKPCHINTKNAKATENFQISTITGKININKFVLFNPFPQSNISKKFKFYVYDFQEFFDGLIGYELLQDLKAKIDTNQNSLICSDFTLCMKRKFPVIRKQTINFMNENKPFSPQKSETINQIENNYNSCNSDIFGKIRHKHLNSEELKCLQKLILNNKQVFYNESDPFTFTTVMKHSIRMKDEIPIYTKSYRFPNCHKEEIQKQVKDMLKKNIIRESCSPWSSPVWIVPKKDDALGNKKWRMVIDYRKINDKTIDDKYPIPNITDILDKLGRSNYFTTLDLASGFHQIEIDKKDVEKTAFTVEHGHYEFLRMPFGLKNAPSTFARIMDYILKDFIGFNCLVYLDDVICFSSSLQEHMITLNKILKRLSECNLKINLDKSEFLCKEVGFLGHIVTKDGVKPNPNKLNVVKNWPLPKNEKELRGFLGTVGYYRRFIKDFAKITKPLTQQLRKGEKIEHTKAFIDAFETAKEILTSSS